MKCNYENCEEIMEGNNLFCYKHMKDVLYEVFGEPQPEADRPMQIPAVVRSNQAPETNEEGLIFCPFNNTEKEIGHNPYIDIVEGFYHACCTCGAMGPMMANRNLAIKSWNNRA